MIDKKKVIIDTDPGIDDALALILASKIPELDILGITTVAGNVPVEQGTQNALDILNLVNRNDINVYKGSDKPLVKEMVNALETHGDNGLGNYALEVSPKKEQGDAVAFLYETLKNEKDVSIIALGPLTNIARLIEEYPEVVENIKELVLMGGNYKSHGNCSPVAEYNFWFDPEAAKIVFDKLARPITMVGLDVTRDILLTPTYSTLIKYFGGEVAEAIYNIVQHYNDFHWEQEKVLGCVINDPLAVAQLIDPELCKTEDYFVEIITDGPARGMSMVDDHNFTKNIPNSRVATSVDHKKFFNYFLGTIFPEHKKDIALVLGDTTYGS